MPIPCRRSRTRSGRSARDEIIISTHPEGRSNWLERGVVTSARERFAVPLTHVVVDLQAEVDRGLGGRR